VKELYNENYKTPMKEIEEDTQKLERCSWLEDVILLRCPYHPK
jgi:hypothetical protein